MASKVIPFDSGRKLAARQEYQRATGGNDSQINRRIVLCFERTASIRKAALAVGRGDTYASRVIWEMCFGRDKAAERKAA